MATHGLARGPAHAGSVGVHGGPRRAVLQLLPFSTRETRKVTLLGGGYPVRRGACDGARLWFSSYIQTYLERDVRAVTAVKDLATFRRFRALLASRHGGGAEQDRSRRAPRRERADYHPVAERSRNHGVDIRSCRHSLKILASADVQISEDLYRGLWLGVSPVRHRLGRRTGKNRRFTAHCSRGLWRQKSLKPRPTPVDGVKSTIFATSRA